MPNAGHIVHMPAHIYIRTGQYARSVELNLRAAKVDEDYPAYSANQGYYRLALYPHNVDFISFSSYMDGRSNLGIQNALRLAYKGNLITNSNPVFAQYFNVEPLLAYTRFGKWGDILSLADPDANLVYSNLVWRFARGMAYTRQGNIAQAEFELEKLDSLCKLDTLQSIYFTFNPASDVAKIPVALLRGEVLIKKGKVDEGIASLAEAVKAEGNLRYMEPPDWKIPSRHFLGAAFYDAGKYAEAEAVYLEDLKQNPENGWSLTGLQLTQGKLGKKSEVIATGKRERKPGRILISPLRLRDFKRRLLILSATSTLDAGYPILDDQAVEVMRLACCAHIPAALLMSGRGHLNGHVYADEEGAATSCHFKALASGIRHRACSHEWECRTIFSVCTS